MNRRRVFYLFSVLMMLVLGTGLYLRASGLLRGLDRGVIYHPDAAKQVNMLDHYLHGNDVIYYDSLFYDGYPYGLNRLDETVIRLGHGGWSAVRGWIDPESYQPDMPPRPALYVAGRMLRVTYGLITMCLIFATVRRLGGGQWAALAAMALYGLAPLGSTVTHSVTGDIGVDLTVALAMRAAAGYAAGGGAVSLLLFGFACGFGFACKFQGALAAWLLLLPFALWWWRDRRRWSLLLRQGLMVIAGVIAGVVAGTPGLLIDPEKTWRNMRKNFAFIKDYGVSEEFLAQPFLTKVTHGLTHNIPEAVSSLGLFFMLAAFGALVWACRQRWPARTGDNGAGAIAPDERLPAVRLALASFPFLALLLSTALKPMVQPFHFSFIAPAMAVSTGILLIAAGGWTSALSRVILGLTLIAALVQSGLASIREDRYWSRSEASLLSSDFSRIVFDSRNYASKHITGRAIIKQFYTEPALLSVFRNRPSGLQHDDAAWWREQRILPVPSLPWPDNSHWIFVNGPVFPIHDRMWALPASGPGMTGRIDSQPHRRDEPMMIPTAAADGRWLYRTLVYPRATNTVHIGLRTGRWPSRYALCIGGRDQIGFLGPHEQTILHVEDMHWWREPEVDHNKPEVHHLDIAMKSQLGPLWITVLDTAEEMALYEAHGPDAASADLSAYPRAEPDELARQMEILHYLRGTNAMVFNHLPVRLPGDAAPLAAGSYAVTAHLLNTNAHDISLQFELRDLSFLPHGVPPTNFIIPPGAHEVTWSFTKTFVPYDALVFCSTVTNDLTLLRWQLKPDIAAPAPPADLAPYEPVVLPHQELNVTYPGRGRVKALLIPREIAAGADFGYSVRMDIDPAIDHKEFHEAVVFLHVKNEAGEHVASLDFPLRKVSMADHLIHHYPGRFDATLPPGRYVIEGGIYNIRTRIRHDFEPTDAHNANVRKRFFRWGEITVR